MAKKMVKSTTDYGYPNFQTLLAVYAGASVNALTPVAANTGATGSSVTFTTQPNVIYHIAVDGFNDQYGTFNLNFSTPAPPKPTNDNFANRIALPPLFGTAIGYNMGATKEAGEPNNADATIVGGPGVIGGASVWWKWVPQSSGTVTLDFSKTAIPDPLIAVYTGSSVSALTRIADDSNYFTSNVATITFNVQAGTEYQISVDGYNFGSGAETNNISVSCSSGSPDLCNATGASLASNPTNNDIPTLPQWGLLLMSAILLVVGASSVSNRRVG